MLRSTVMYGSPAFKSWLMDGCNMLWWVLPSTWTFLQFLQLTLINCIVGTAITVLVDKTFLNNNIQSMDQSSISSMDIIRRLQYYISYVSLRGVPHCTTMKLPCISALRSVIGAQAISNRKRRHVYIMTYMYYTITINEQVSSEDTHISTPWM